MGTQTTLTWIDDEGRPHTTHVYRAVLTLRPTVVDADPIRRELPSPTVDDVEDVDDRTCEDCGYVDDYDLNDCDGCEMHLCNSCAEEHAGLHAQEEDTQP